jgi:hypothetical protein
MRGPNEPTRTWERACYTKNGLAGRRAPAQNKVASMKRLIVPGLAALLAGFVITGWTRERAPPAIAHGAQVGVVNLVDPEVMHYHAAKDANDSFLKIQAVNWSVEEMLATALKDQLAQLGLIFAPLSPTDALVRARESCFVNASLAAGLPKSCSQPLMEQASGAGVNYLILMAPGLNDENHAGKNRIETVTAMMRGWGFLTRERAGAKDKPTLFNEIELLLVSVSPEGVALRARQWGGVYTSQWQNYTLPADPRQLPDEQLNQLQPLFAALLSRQAKDLLDQVRVEP